MLSTNSISTLMGWHSPRLSELPPAHLAGSNLSVPGSAICGLNTAPRVFTKLLKHVVTFLRIQVIRLLIYLDDFHLVVSNPPILHEHTKLVLEFLQNLGFIINFEKSMLTPSPVIEFLGFVISSITMKFYLPQEKITKTSHLCKCLLKNNPNSLRPLAQLLGFSGIWSTSNMVAPPPLYCRHLQSCLIQKVASNNGSYDGTVHLNKLAQKELQWWIANIQQVNGSPICPPSSEMVITSDGSKMGWSSTCGNLSTNDRWSHQENLLHINVLELKAAFLAIQAFLKHQSHISIKLCLDNTTAVSYINSQCGTRSPKLIALTLDLWNWCLQHNIFIKAEYLPGVQSDRESRTLSDSSDWRMQPQIIQPFL